MKRFYKPNMWALYINNLSFIRSKLIVYPDTHPAQRGVGSGGDEG